MSTFKSEKLFYIQILVGHCWLYARFGYFYQRRPKLQQTLFSQMICIYFYAKNHATQYKNIIKSLRTQRIGNILGSGAAFSTRMFIIFSAFFLCIISNIADSREVEAYFMLEGKKSAKDYNACTRPLNNPLLIIGSIYVIYVFIRLREKQPKILYSKVHNVSAKIDKKYLVLYNTFLATLTVFTCTFL